jgi:hypothetical protein
MLKLPIHDPEVRTVVTCVIGFHLSAKAVPRLFSQGCSAKAVQPRLFSQGCSAKAVQPRLFSQGCSVKRLAERLKQSFSLG